MGAPIPALPQPSASRGTSASWRFRLARREFAVVCALFCLAAFLRLTGIDWDAGHHLHPDERFLTMLAADVRLPSGPSAYFDTARSPLNPANVGRSYFTYGTLPLLLVRAGAEAAGLTDYDRIPLVGRTMAGIFDLGTLLFAWLIARRLGGPVAGLATLALLAFSVLSIQQAHFFTVDSFAACFATAALWIAVRAMLGGGLAMHAGFGAAIGLMLACRLNLLVLAAMYPATLLVAWRQDRRTLRQLAAAAALAVAFAMATFRVSQPYAFTGPFWSIPALAPDFVKSIRTIFAFSTGAADFPPSVQWIGRLPILFPAWNLFVWAVGPAFGAAAIVSAVWALVRRAPPEQTRVVAATRVVVLWALLLFFFHSTQFVATLRYFLPVIPAFAVLTGCCFTITRRRSHLVALVAVVVFTGAWALAFTSIYRRPHTRVHASQWLYEELPAGTTIATEHWDDALPLGVNGRSAAEYEHVELALYEDENEAKRTALIAALDKADAIVLSSNRLYRSIPRAPWRYPLARRYYELLFAGDLGFRLERVFTSRPRLAGLEIADDEAEEAFTVYDHPKVMVFRKTSTYSHEGVASVLGAVSLAQVQRVPPGETAELYRQIRPTDVPLPGEASAHAATAPVSISSAEATIRWLAVLEVTSLTVFALLFGVWPALPDRGYGIAKLLAWLAPATVVWLLASYGVVDTGARTARVVTGGLLVSGAVAGWTSRRSIRAWAVGAGARREVAVVEALFLAAFACFAALRAWNPAVAWGEKPMDFAILNAILRSPGLPPADPWYAGAPLNYFYFGHFVTAITAQLAGVPPAFAFNLALATIAALVATTGFLVARQLSARIAVGVLTAAALLVVGNFAGPRLLLAIPSRRIGFDYFWATSRVVPGTINEYPVWSLAFADLHAHVLAMPLELALLWLGLTWQARRGPAGTIPRLALILTSVWVLGSLAMTSSWSALTAVVLQLGLLLTAWRTQRTGLAGLLQAVACWSAIVVGAVLLYLPFWSQYASPSSHWGTVRNEAAPVLDVVTIFGPLLVMGLPLLVVRRVAGATHLRPAAALAVIALVVVTAAGARSPSCGLFVGVALIGVSTWLVDDDAGVRAAGLCFGAAGAVGAATEVVFLWDRMNTVFKFYLQMWLLLTPAAVALAAWSVQRTGGAVRILALATFGLAAAGGLVTSLTGVVGLLREPRVPGPAPTLDGLAYLRDRGPAELEAFTWINQHVDGIPVVLEAHGPSYQNYSRVSMNTGLPTVLGWEYHVFQQSRARDQIGSRAADISELYETTDLDRAGQLLAHYHVDLVVVGGLERDTYKAPGLAKFTGWHALRRVFGNRDVTVYATRDFDSRVRTPIRAIAPTIALGRLLEPRGLARASDGTFALADFGNRRIVLAAADGTPQGQFGDAGEGPGQFRDPCAVAFDGDGMILVADTWNHRIQRLTRGGDMLAEWRADLYGPRGITRASDGSIYVTDTGNHRVMRFTAGGTATEVVPRGTLDNPVGIAIAANGEIFVADVGHSRIAVFSPAGALIHSWAVEGWKVAPYHEPQLALAADGVLWVTDPPHARILLFDRSGRLLGTAEPAAPLGTPTGIALVDQATAMVSDAGKNRLITVKRRIVSRDTPAAVTR